MLIGPACCLYMRLFVWHYFDSKPQREANVMSEKAKTASSTVYATPAQQSNDTQHVDTTLVARGREREIENSKSTGIFHRKARKTSGAGTIFQQGGQAWCVTQSFPAGGLGGVRPQAGPGAEPRRQTHFGNNLLKIYLKSGLWFVVYTPNSDPISDVHWLVRR